MTDATPTGPATPVVLDSNGSLFDQNGNLVKLKPTKAVIGGIIGFASMVSTSLTAIYTDSVALVIVNIVIGSAATVLGIFIPGNRKA